MNNADRAAKAEQLKIPYDVFTDTQGFIKQTFSHQLGADQSGNGTAADVPVRKADAKSLTDQMRIQFPDSIAGVKTVW